MELTQEYFDRGLENLSTRLDDLVTNQTLTKKLDDQTQELKDYTHQAFEAQQTYIEERFKEVIALIDVRKDVEALKRYMDKIKGALDAKDLKISRQS